MLRAARLKMVKQKPPPRFLETTRPVAIAHGCRRRVLSCRVHGESRLIDPVRITLAAEAQALIMGLRTFEIGVLGKGYPSWRNRFAISAGYPKYGHIHPQHLCGMSWDSEGYRDQRSIFESAHTGDEPPF